MKTLGTKNIANNIELGHDTDTTLSRKEAGEMNIEGKQVLTEDNAVNVTEKRLSHRTLSETSISSLTPDKATHDKAQISALDETALTLNLPDNMTATDKSYIVDVLVASTTDFTPNAGYVFAVDNDAPAELEADHRYQFVIDRQGDDYFISFVSWDLS
jgi:hypothetical protein